MAFSQNGKKRWLSYLSSGVSTWNVRSITVVHWRHRIINVFGFGRSVFINWHSSNKIKCLFEYAYIQTKKQTTEFDSKHNHCDLTASYGLHITFPKHSLLRFPVSIPLLSGMLAIYLTLIHKQLPKSKERLFFKVQIKAYSLHEALVTSWP